MQSLTAVYIGLEIDLRDMLVYKFRQLMVTDDLHVDNFPADILEAAKDPIVGITKFYLEIREVFYLDFDEFVEHSEKLSRAIIFEQAGREVIDVLDSINNTMSTMGLDINMFNYAKYDCRSILLLSVNNLEQADVL